MTQSTNPTTATPDPFGERLILTLACPDQTGIVAAVSTLIAENGGWIVCSDNHSDSKTNTFYMREEIDTQSLSLSANEFRRKLESLASTFKMTWRLRSTAQRPRVAIFVTTAEHCLYDLLGRSRADELGGDIACVVANRESLRDVVESHGIDFLNFGDKDGRCDFTRAASELESRDVDVVVLARFMQVLPPWLCERYAGRMINIHHSFLPSFKGADPYRQALERGVKLVGATCHYVTEELDEGPIIEQDVTRITHAHSLGELRRAGKDIEKAVLARGLRWHLEDRVFLAGNRTVVLT